MKDIFTVHLTLKAKKDLKKVPLHIAINFQAWIDEVMLRGVSEVRKISGYHDEPLKGKRKGQRSIRLSKSYRAFYIENKNDEIQFLEVCEVNKHDY